MATDEADAAVGPGFDDESGPATASGDAAVVGEYTWSDFLREHGREDAADELADRLRTEIVEENEDGEEVVRIEVRAATAEDLTAVGVADVIANALGIDPGEVPTTVGTAGALGESIAGRSPLLAYDETPVWKDIYTWDDYREEYFLEDDGTPPTDEEDEPLEFTDADKAEALGFDPNRVEETLGHLAKRAPELDEVIDERTVDIADDVDEDEFFSDAAGTTTIANRYDLEKAVPMEKKRHFVEEERYWVNKPYACVVIFHSRKENERKYYAIQPYQNDIEAQIAEFLSGKLRSAIKYSDDDVVVEGTDTDRANVIQRETEQLLDRYDLYTPPEQREMGMVDQMKDMLGMDVALDTVAVRYDGTAVGGLDGIASTEPEGEAWHAGGQWTLRAASEETPFESGGTLQVVWTSDDGGGSAVLAEATLP